jgi:hypothetical protein
LKKRKKSLIIFVFLTFYNKFFLDSFKPNKFTAFTSFYPEKDYWYLIYKEFQLENTLEDLYYNFGRFYLRCGKDIFDGRIRFILNNSSLSKPRILLLPEMNESFLTQKERS